MEKAGRGNEPETAKFDPILPVLTNFFGQILGTGWRTCRAPCKIGPVATVRTGIRPILSASVAWAPRYGARLFPRRR